MLIKHYVAYWYTTYKMPMHAETTAQVTMNYINVHIVRSKLGNMELSEAHTADFQEFLRDLLMHGNKCRLKGIDSYGKPLGFWTVRKIRQLLISAYNQAIKEGLVIRNYAAETAPISIPYKSMNIFSAEQQQKFLDHTRNHRFYAAYVLLFYTGMRRSELLGLSWNNINWQKNTILINQTLVVVNGKPILKQRTKTSRSLRSIPIPDAVKAILRDWYHRQNREKRIAETWINTYNLVFVNLDGSPHNPVYFSRNFKNILKRMKLPPDLHLHSTRHTWATNMMQCDNPITDVQSLGGWSRPDVLLNIYAHTVQKSQRKAIGRLFKYLHSK